MPEKKTIKKAKKALGEGKSPSTAAGEFVREEIDHVRHGKHGARSTKQLIAIGLSKARRAGVPLSPPEKGTTSSRTRKTAKRDLAVGKKKAKTGAAATGKGKAAKTSRARAATSALKRQGRKAASSASLSRQAKRTASKRRARTSRR